MVAALQSEGAILHVGYPWWLGLFLLRGVLAITLGRHVYLRDAPKDERILRHELAHVRQVNRLGLFRFFVQYGWELVRNLARERSFDRAYRTISFEREAYEAEDL